MVRGRNCLKEVWVDIDGDTAEADRLLPLQQSSTVRAVKSNLVMDRFAQVFADNVKPDTETEANRLFNLSYDADAIDHFISHSWSAGRLWKWAALADFYHRKTATVLANVSWLLLTLGGCLWRSYTGEAQKFLSASIIFTCLPCFLVMLVTAIGHRLAPWLGSKVFVDRICIHQWDDELKANGVKSLGHMLHASRQMMVLWSHDYFHRLWCVFEIAVFSHSHSKCPNEMLILPLWKTPLLYGLLIGNVCVMLVGAVAEQRAIFVPLIAAFGQARGLGVHFAVINLLPTVLICYVIRSAMREKRRMEHDISNFIIWKAQVSVDMDRDFIYRHIRDLFGSTDDFEEFVRDSLNHYVREVVGLAWQLPYSYGAFGFLPYLWYLTSDALSMSDEAAQTFGCANWQVYFLANIFFYGCLYMLMPITLKGAAFSAHRTSTWPFAIGLTLDVCVFVGMVYCITVISMTLYELCFLSRLDMSVVQPPDWGAFT